jgi:putative transposase
METDFCVEALQDAINQYGRPEIFNTDQGVQFTSTDFLDELEARGIRISMDGKGRFLDNIFIERLWRSLKYEEIFIKAYASVAEARRGIAAWLAFYNDERPHQALSYLTPRAVFRANRRSVETEIAAMLEAADCILGSDAVERGAERFLQ